MTAKSQTEKDESPESINNMEDEKVLCPHCRRTATNSIKCKGICVADNDY